MRFGRAYVARNPAWLLRCYFHSRASDARNLIGEDAIRRMKKGATLINTARGGVVDEEALSSALKDGHLAGAAIDVFAEEPLNAQRGAIFRDCPNLLATPHIAGVTVESNVRVSWATADNIRRHLAGLIR